MKKMLAGIQDKCPNIGPLLRAQKKKKSTCSPRRTFTEERDLARLLSKTGELPPNPSAPPPAPQR